MLNKFPLWKNLLLAFVIIIGFIYAAPNLYGDVPAVQITGNSSTALIDDALVNKVTTALDQAKLPYVDMRRENNSLLVLFNKTNTDAQFRAQSVLKQSVIGSDYTAAINLVPASPQWLQAINATPMKLGLDLRGGINFLLEVDIQSVVAKRMLGLSKTMMEQLRSQHIRYTNITISKNNVIILNFKDQDNLSRGLSELQSITNDVIFSKSPSNPLQLVATPTPTFLENVRQSTIDQMTTTLRNRVNELGIAEPLVQQQGADRIAIDLPGVQDSARAKQILGGTATLEFHLVSGENNPATLQSGIAPPGTKFYTTEDGRQILLDSQVLLSGDSITSAAASFDQTTGRPIVDISLGGGGESYFSRVTQENVGNRMAIVYIETKSVDQVVNGQTVRIHKKQEKVISDAVIESGLGSRFQISGLDIVEAKNLSLLLRSGAMPTNVDIIQERTVGPSLGLENIHMGALSVEVAFILIVIFMLFYYQLFGLFADMALFLNLVLIVAVMSMIGMTLTLPGIAGIVLTVGMAVDANVLIFERIREELRHGITPQAAIHAGFERAFGTIVDANVSTLIVATVLFSVGTGPVQGFAVTLTVGILTSMFTAITFTRALVNWTYGGRTVKTLMIGMRHQHNQLQAQKG